MTKLPPTTPAWAAMIWSDGSHLYLDLPNTTGYQRHTTRFPLNEAGLSTALKLIRNRTETSRLAETGDLTQAQVDKLIADFGKPTVVRPKPTFTPKIKSAAREVLRNLRMI